MAYGQGMVARVIFRLSIYVPMPLTYLKALIRGYARGSRKDAEVFKLSFKHQASSFKLHPITESKAVKEAFRHVVLEGALVTLLNTGIVHSVDA